MAQAVIGALRVTLGLNSAELTKGMSKADREMQQFAAKMKRVGVAMAAAVAAGGAAVAASVKDVSDYADEMGKSAQSVGVVVENLSELRHAAEMSGASFGDLQTGLRKLSQTMGDALATPTSEGAKALASLGISVRDSAGELKSSEDVLEEISDAFAGLEDGVLKTDAAMAIFGRSGTALIPMLNAGRDGMEAMRQEARELGLTITNDTFRAAEAFNDNLERMRKFFRGIQIQLVSGVLPAFRNLSDRLVAGLTQSGALDGAIAGLSVAFNVLAGVVTVVFDNLGHLYDLFKVFIAAQIVRGVTAMAGSFISLAKAIRVSGLVSAAFTKVTRLKISALALAAAVIAKLTGTYDSLAGYIRDTGQAIADALPESLKGKISELGNQLTIFGGQINESDAAIAGSAKAYVDWADLAKKSFGKVATSSRAASKTGVAAAKQVKDAVSGIGDATAKTTDAMISRFKDVGSSIGGALKGMISGTKTWQDALLGVVSTLGQMVLNSFSPTSSGGGLLKGLLGGLMGFANGGSFNVGGTGGVDSQLVAFKASPNERVTITKPNQVAARAGTASNSNLHVTVGIDDEGALQAFVSRKVDGAMENVPNIVDQRTLENQANRFSA